MFFLLDFGEQAKICFQHYFCDLLFYMRSGEKGWVISALNVPSSSCAENVIYIRNIFRNFRIANKRGPDS
jgi:hypothetical protein